MKKKNTWKFTKNLENVLNFVTSEKGNSGRSVETSGIIITSTRLINCRAILEVTHNIANALSTPTRNVRFLHSAFDAMGDSFVASDYQGNIFKFDINRNR